MELELWKLEAELAAYWLQQQVLDKPHYDREL